MISHSEREFLPVSMKDCKADPDLTHPRSYRMKKKQVTNVIRTNQQPERNSSAQFAPTSLGCGTASWS